MSLLKKLPKPMLPDETRRDIQARESYHVLKIISEFVEAGENCAPFSQPSAFTAARARLKTIPTTSSHYAWHANCRMPDFPSFPAVGRALWKRPTKARLQAQVRRWG